MNSRGMSDGDFHLRMPIYAASIAIIVRVSKNLLKKSSLRVAIKVITPTSDPNRVYREINFLRRSGKF